MMFQTSERVKIWWSDSGEKEIESQVNRTNGLKGIWKQKRCSLKKESYEEQELPCGENNPKLKGSVFRSDGLFCEFMASPCE